MAIFQLPATLLLSRLVMGQKRYDLSFENAESGATSTRITSPPRWTMSFTSAQEMDTLQASEWEALVLRLRGRVNHLEAWDVGKPVPLGTLRGDIVTVGSHPKGATQIQMQSPGQAQKTLVPGDWLQLGSGLGTSQLVKVVDPAVSDMEGNLTVTVEPPLRLAFPSGTAVTWDRPTAFYKNTQDATSWTYERAIQGGFSFDGLEQWS